jgi:hypothetical protein
MILTHLVWQFESRFSIPERMKWENHGFACQASQPYYLRSTVIRVYKTLFQLPSLSFTPSLLRGVCQKHRKGYPCCWAVLPPFKIPKSQEMLQMLLCVSPKALDYRQMCKAQFAVPKTRSLVFHALREERESNGVNNDVSNEEGLRNVLQTSLRQKTHFNSHIKAPRRTSSPLLSTTHHYWETITKSR